MLRPWNPFLSSFILILIALYSINNFQCIESFSLQSFRLNPVLRMARLKMSSPQFVKDAQKIKKKIKKGQTGTGQQIQTEVEQAVQRKEEVKSKKKSKIKDELDKKWRVILYNDEQNIIDDVIDYLQEVSLSRLRFISFLKFVFVSVSVVFFPTIIGGSLN
jgi:replicative DNA helicase